MLDESMDAIVAQVMTTVLHRPVGADEDFRRKDEERWDSLKHIEIIFALEAAFEVQFTEEDISSVDSVSALKAKLEELRTTKCNTASL